ncbi:hypothetical protein GCM10010270_31350 [Streptomyces violaceus]|nr:hypothetical protein GCM10010270_31350 [Streptomyces janthinus]
MASGDASLAGAEAAWPGAEAGVCRWAGTRNSSGPVAEGAVEAKGAGVSAVGAGPADESAATLAAAGDEACCAARGAGVGIASGGSRPCSGPPVLALPVVEAGGTAVPSAGVSGAAVGLPTGRIAAGRRPSGVPGSLSGVVGFLRGVNQPPPPPEVPLSADVVVGASMVCLASSIFRSVCALP